jgi:uncharacterized protein (UPF0333 family)
MEEVTHIMATRRNWNRGQVTVEVAILFAFVIAALVAMALYLQRGVQGGVKSNSDSFGTQFGSVDAWTLNIQSTTTETPADVQTQQATTYNQALN